MSDILPQVEPEESGRVTRLDVPMSRFMSESFHAGEDSSMYSAVSHITEDQIDKTSQARTMQPDEANQKYAIGSLKFNQPANESLAQSMNERERNRMDQEMYLYSGASRGRFLPGMAASVLGATANPLDLGSMFIPFVGEGGKVAELGRVANTLRRGLIPMETFDKVPAPKLAASMTQALMWQGMDEVPKLYEAHVENQPTPAIGADMLGQAAFAGVLHGVGSALRMFSPRTHNIMSEQAMNDFLSDRDTSSHQYIPLDEHVITYQAMEHDRMLREEAANHINLEEIKRDVVKEMGEYPIDAAYRHAVTGEVRTGPAHSLIDTEGMGDLNHLQEGFVTDKNRFVSRGEAAQLAGVAGDTEYNHLLLQNDKHLMSSEQLGEMADPDYLSHSENVRFQELKEQYGLTDAEAMNKVREHRLKNREQRILANPRVQNEIEERRQQAISDWVQNKKTEIRQPVTAEVERSASEQTVPRQDVEKYTGEPDHLNAGLDEDIEALQPVHGGAERDLPEEQRKISQKNNSKEAFIEAQKKAENEQIKMSNTIDTAVSCILEKIA